MRRRFVVPVAFASLAVVAVLAAPALDPAAPEEIMLARLPEAVSSGASLPIVVAIVRGGDPFDGGTLVPLPVEVSVADDQGRGLLRARLAPGVDGKTRGELVVPRNLRGVVWLELRARSSARLLALRGRVRIETQPPVAAQVRRPGVVGVSPTDPDFLVRAEGGACAPDLPCRVFVAEPVDAAPVRYRAGEGTTVLAEARHDHLVVLDVRIAGFGGRIFAEREGTADGPLELGIPVQLGSARFVPERAFARDGRVRFTLTRSLPPPFVEIDRYVDDRWLETRVFPYRALARGIDWPSHLVPGLHRFEARDAAGASMASCSVLVPRRPTDVALPFDAVSSRGDPWATRRREVAPSPETIDDELRSASAMRLLLGTPERPPALDSRVQRAMGSTAAPSGRRIGLAMLVVVLGMASALYVARRGAAAQREADAILEDAGARPTHGVGFDSLLPWTLVLAFVAAAAMVLYRG